MSSHIPDGQHVSMAEKQELDLLYLLAEMIDRRVLILTVTLVFTVCATFYAFIATPVYRADALVQVEGKQDNNLLKNLASLSPELSPDAAPEMLLLKSRMILGHTVDDLGLNYDVRAHYFPVVGRIWARLFGQKNATLTVTRLHIPQVDGVPGLLRLTILDDRHYQIEGEGIEGRGTTGTLYAKGDTAILVSSMKASPGSQFVIRERTPLEAINVLSKSFVVSESTKQSGVLNLSLTGADPELIARTLNSITENYLQQNIARHAAQDARSLAFLQQQLPEIRSELDQSEERLNEYRQKRDSVDLTLEAKSVLEQIVNVDNQLNELTFREAEISQLFKKDHPTYRALREKRQTLEDEKTRLSKRVSTMPSTQQEILRLSRDVDSGRAIYLQLLTRQQELSISRSSAIGNVRIIDTAVTQPDPIAPAKPLIIILGTLFGFIFACGYVLVRSALKRGIELPEQLETGGMSVLATLPRSQWLWSQTRVRGASLISRRWKHKTSDVPFLPVDRPLDNFVEAMRGLRTSLHFMMMGAENRTVMISGPTQDCGKTLVSTTLASVIAQGGKKVLFIDADMRKGYVHEVFRLQNQCGLADILSGKSEFASAVQQYAVGGLDVITCGQIPTQPSELLMNDRLSLLLKWANEHYDMVIVDTPPILAVTDGLMAGRLAGTTLLVARFGKSSVKEMLACVKRLEQAGVRVKGVILNDVVKSAALHYGSGYSYYDYSYSADNKKHG